MITENDFDFEGLFVLDLANNYQSSVDQVYFSMPRAGTLSDITTDIVARYVAEEPTRVCEVSALLEFGTEADLQKAREFWESH